MHPPLKHIVSAQTLWLSTERCIYWEEQRWLILADLHLGKTGHFRKAGIGVPQTVFKEDMQRLVNAVQFFKPEQLIIVGDMFHSESNKELELFSRWRKDFSALAVCLVKGNHDILQDQWYKAAAIDVHTDELATEYFVFRHHYSMPAGESNDKYFFSGHIHPGVHIKGTSRQFLRLPCFHFTTHCCTLPSFSRFTGLATVTPGRKDKVFAIVNDKVMRV
ncbi:MAG TPA: ligase-associated DNA damage response endonuclease PdeM [Agriterribacter sp.]|nr:ligase-associated DNA damage response endonuclease PdeM [Agriterribacter sp.]